MLIVNILRTAIIAIVLIMLGKIGLSSWLGAHPFWATKVVYLGVAIGAVISIPLLFLIQKNWFHSKVPIILTAVFTLAVAAVTLLYGKAEFAASYAENAFAGKVWYLGFIALFAGMFLVLATSYHALRAHMLR